MQQADWQTWDSGNFLSAKAYQDCDEDGLRDKIRVKAVDPTLRKLVET
jgi:hypothetical protein